jgi:uncharacterized protein YhfF
MFDRIEGLRTLVLGEPGSDLQRKLNQLVLSRKKTGTSSVDDGEYAAKNEPFETVGEREWLVDELGQPIALIEYTTIERVPFKDVSWEFVVSEGEGFTSVEDWQESHKAFWSECGIQVNPDTEVICYSFRVLDVIADDSRLARKRHLMKQNIRLIGGFAALIVGAPIALLLPEFGIPLC